MHLTADRRWEEVGRGLSGAAPPSPFPRLPHPPLALSKGSQGWGAGEWGACFCRAFSSR